MNLNNLSFLAYNQDILYYEFLIHGSRMFRMEHHMQDGTPVLIRLDREHLIELMKLRIEEIIPYQLGYYQPDDVDCKARLVKRLQLLDFYNTLYCTGIEETKLIPEHLNVYKFGPPYDLDIAMWAIAKTYLEDHLQERLKQEISFFDFRHQLETKWGIEPSDMLKNVIKIGRSGSLTQPLLTETYRLEVPFDRPLTSSQDSKILIRTRQVKDNLTSAFYSVNSLKDAGELNVNNHLARRELMIKLDEVINNPSMRVRTVESVDFMHDINASLDLFAALVIGMAEPKFEPHLLPFCDWLFEQVADYVIMAELSGAPLIVRKPLGNSGVVKAAHAAINALEKGDLFLSCVWIRTMSNLIL